MARLFGACTLTMWFIGALAAMEPALDPAAIQEAIAIGQSRLSQERDRFHAPYRVVVSSAPIDFVEVVTPFRRVVLEAQNRAAIGDRMFGQRQAVAALDAAPHRLDVNVELTFHPLNTYVGVPEYAVVVVRPQDPTPLAPLATDRIPRFGARIEGPPQPTAVPTGPVFRGGSQPLLGGTIVAQFNATRLDPNGVFDVLIREGRQELARARVNLRQMR
jgi:hypothetical protein